jgi:hypothetical protein
MQAEHWHPPAIPGSTHKHNQDDDWQNDWQQTRNLKEFTASPGPTHLNTSLCTPLLSL